MTIDKPEPGKTYVLTGATDTKCISNGNTWKESENKPNGWPSDKPFTKADAKELEELFGVMGTGIHPDDLNDDGSDLDELEDIMNEG